MLNNYSAVIEAIVQAGTAADSVKANAESVIAALKNQRQTMEAHRGDVMRSANDRADQIVRDATVTAGMIEKMQQGIDAMIAQIEGASPVAVAS